MLYDVANPIVVIYETSDADKRLAGLNAFAEDYENGPWRVAAKWWVPESVPWQNKHWPGMQVRPWSTRKSLLYLCMTGLRELTWAFDREAYISKFLRMNRNVQWQRGGQNNTYRRYSGT